MADRAGRQGSFGAPVTNNLQEALRDSTDWCAYLPSAMLANGRARYRSLAHHFCIKSDRSEPLPELRHKVRETSGRRLGSQIDNPLPEYRSIDESFSPQRSRDCRPSFDHRINVPGQNRCAVVPRSGFVQDAECGGRIYVASSFAIRVLQREAVCGRHTIK